MMLTFPTWVEEGDSKLDSRGDELSTQIGLSMMEVTKVMKKTSRRDSVLMSFDVFKDLYIYATCNLIPLTCLSYVYQIYHIRSAALPICAA